MPRTRKPYSASNASKSDVQPPRAPTGRPQGDRKASLESQAEIPLPNVAGRLDSAVAASLTNTAPPLGDGGLLLAPTARPNEPVTAGAPLGAGPGVEAIPPPMVPTTLDDQAMARYLPMLEALADRPDASDATRNWVKRIRGTLPADITMDSITRPVQ